LRAVQVSSFGGPDVLEWADVPDPVVEADEVLVRVRAVGVNHVDLDIRAGVSGHPIRLPHILGLEVVGEVEELGEACATNLTQGDRVMVRQERTCDECADCLAGRTNLCRRVELIGVHRRGGYAEYVVARPDDLLSLPATLSFEDAAAVQVAFGTAWHALVAVGALQAGETVLVNAAGSGVSSAAIQVATLLGARVIASVGRRAKVPTARASGVAEVVCYEAASLAEAVLSATGGEGVNLVFDPVGGEILRESLRSVCLGGRVVSCGAHGGEITPIDVVGLFRSELTVRGSRMWTRSELEHVLRLVADGKLNPVVDSSYPLRHAQAAHERMAARDHYGKLVLVP